MKKLILVLIIFIFSTPVYSAPGMAGYNGKYIDEGKDEVFDPKLPIYEPDKKPKKIKKIGNEDVYYNSQGRIYKIGDKVVKYED